MGSIKKCYFMIRDSNIILYSDTSCKIVIAAVASYTLYTGGGLMYEREREILKIFFIFCNIFIYIVHRSGIQSI